MMKMAFFTDFIEREKSFALRGTDLAASNADDYTTPVITSPKLSALRCVINRKVG